MPAAARHHFGHDGVRQQKWRGEVGRKRGGKIGVGGLGQRLDEKIPAVF